MAKMSSSFRRSLEPEEVLSLVGDARAAALMRALGLVSKGGGASADARRKIKQITHFARQLIPAFEDVFSRHEEPVIVDAAAGKSYLGLFLYERFMREAGKGTLVLIEQREDLVERLRELVASLGYERVEVRHGSIESVPWPERVHIVVALHACDTATDAALVAAHAAKADYLAVVPCCQAEVSRQLAELPPSAVSTLWGVSWHRREFGAHLTNVLRALAMRSHGYQITVTELAGWEHAVKNELLLGRRVGRFHRAAQEELDALLEQIPVQPALLAPLLKPDGGISETRSEGSGTDAPTEA
ncbi:MAG: hypothetical protein ACI81R_000147 [Bradymonadia bacterium]|jgi:hypothetical protein